MEEEEEAENRARTRDFVGARRVTCRVHFKDKKKRSWEERNISLKRRLRKPFVDRSPATGVCFKPCTGGYIGGGILFRWR